MNPEDGPILLASAVSYALKAAALVKSADMSSPTPCPAWNLSLLLRHLSGSMAALAEALATGRLGAGPDSGRDSGPDPGQPLSADGNGDPVELLRDRAADLLYTMFTAAERMIEVAGLPVPPGLVVGAGAAEITVHGWDVYVACGRGRVVPAALARPLIRLLPRLITARQGLFGSPVAVPPCASPGDRLVAYLGRDPSARHRGRTAPATSYPRVALRG